MQDDPNEPKPIATPEAALRDIEDDCERWDWVRTAGVSREELRKALEQTPPR